MLRLSLGAGTPRIPDSFLAKARWGRYGGLGERMTGTPFLAPLREGRALPRRQHASADSAKGPHPPPAWRRDDTPERAAAMTDVPTRIRTLRGSFRLRGRLQRDGAGKKEQAWIS